MTMTFEVFKEHKLKLAYNTFLGSQREHFMTSIT